MLKVLYQHMQFKLAIKSPTGSYYLAESIFSIDGEQLLNTACKHVLLMMAFWLVRLWRNSSILSWRRRAASWVMGLGPRAGPEAWIMGLGGQERLFSSRSR